jgi:hypothetical protein
MRLEYSDCWDGDADMLTWFPPTPKPAGDRVISWQGDRKTNDIAREYTSFCFGDGEYHFDESRDPVRGQNDDHNQEKHF